MEIAQGGEEGLEHKGRPVTVYATENRRLKLRCDFSERVVSFGRETLISNQFSFLISQGSGMFPQKGIGCAGVPSKYFVSLSRRRAYQI